MNLEKTQVNGFEGAFRGMRNPKNSWDRSDSWFGLLNLDYNDDILDEIVIQWLKEDYPDLIGNTLLTKEQDKKYEKIIEWLLANGTLKTAVQDDDIIDAAFIGPKDMKLAKTLILAGNEHRKFMRQISVSVDITAPLLWWKEFDTYKVATVRNSCSTMHTLLNQPFTAEQFTRYGINEVPEAREHFENTLKVLNWLRLKYMENMDKKYWRAIIELLPDGFELKATVTLNYETLLSICSPGQRRFHKLDEWSGIDFQGEKENIISWARKLPYAQDLLFIDEQVN